MREALGVRADVLVVKSTRPGAGAGHHLECIGKCECFRPGEVARLAQVSAGAADVLLKGVVVASKRPDRIVAKGSSQAAEI